MSFLLPYGKLNATVKEKLKQTENSKFLRLHVRKAFHMIEAFTNKRYKSTIRNLVSHNIFSKL